MFLSHSFSVSINLAFEHCWFSPFVIPAAKADPWRGAADWTNAGHILFLSAFLPSLYLYGFYLEKDNFIFVSQLHTCPFPLTTESCLFCHVLISALPSMPPSVSPIPFLISCYLLSLCSSDPDPLVTSLHFILLPAWVSSSFFFLFTFFFFFFFYSSLPVFIIFYTGMWSANQVGEASPSKSFLKFSRPVWETSHPVPVVCVCGCVCVCFGVALWKLEHSYLLFALSLFSV